MSRANIWYPGRAWWKVELRFTNKALLHMAAGPIIPGQKVTLNADLMKKKTSRSISKFVTVKRIVPVSMHAGLRSRSVYMEFDGKLMTKGAATKLTHKCGYRSIAALADSLRIKYGLPYYGQVIIW